MDGRLDQQLNKRTI